MSLLHFSSLRPLDKDIHEVENSCVLIADAFSMDVRVVGKVEFLSRSSARAA